MTSPVARVKMAANGRLVLPQAFRQALGLNGEAQLVLSIVNGEIRLSTATQRWEKARELFRRHAVHDRSSDDFLADRKEEADREDRKLG